MYEKGRAELDVVLDARPRNTEAMAAVAYSWLLQGELDRAQELYERILKITPDHLGALNNYATVLAEKREYGKAISIWTRALRLDPDNRNIRDNIEEAKDWEYMMRE